MIFAYRNVNSGSTHLVHASDWWDASTAFGYMHREMERLGCIAPALAPAARLMRFRNEDAFKAWRNAAWALYLKHHNAA
jgi:hypothetical protein